MRQDRRALRYVPDDIKQSFRDRGNLEASGFATRKLDEKNHTNNLPREIVHFEKDPMGTRMPGLINSFLGGRRRKQTKRKQTKRKRTKRQYW